MQTVEPLALAGGESSRAAQARVGAVLDRLAGRHPDETIAVSTHGNLIVLTLHAHDRSIGFDLWRAMPMPAVYPLDVEGRGQTPNGSVT